MDVLLYPLSHSPQQKAMYKFVEEEQIRFKIYDGFSAN